MEPPLNLQSLPNATQQQQYNNNNNNTSPPHPHQAFLQNERQVIRRAGRQAICQFLEQHSCFSVLRASGKVVVFDVRIPIQLAFYALVEHDMLVAPLWDSVSCQFVGLLTVTDFIDILRLYRQSTGKDVAALAASSIAEILHDAANDPHHPVPLRPFAGADSSCTLKQACQLLLRGSTLRRTDPHPLATDKPKKKCSQDFLPIVFTEDMRVLACITYTNVLEHLVTNFREQRRLFDDTLADLPIGTYGDQLVVAHAHQNLAVALELMYVHDLSALPVVVDDAGSSSSSAATPSGAGPRGKLVGVYSRSDITFLTKATDAEDAIRHLDLPLSEVLAQTRQDVTTPDALRTCSPQHTLQAIFESFAQFRFNRLYVVDAEDQLLGVVSARDLVAYFLTPDDDGAPIGGSNQGY